MAELSAASVRTMTGLPTVILDERHLAAAGLEKPHHLKFRLFDLVPEADAILYFDADTVFLRKWNPREFAGGRELVAIGDRPTHDSVAYDAAQIRMEVRQYFNTGLFIVNRRHHAAMLHKAHYYEGYFRSIFHDQTALNAARHRARIPLRLLPREYNWLDFDRSSGHPEAIVGHFYQIDHLPIDEARRYFRRWQAKGKAAAILPPKKNGASTRPVKKAARKQPQPRLSPEEVRHFNMAYWAAGNPPPMSEGAHSGRGVVVCGGGEKYFPCVWVCVRMLRMLGCTLPIEVWHLGAAEMRDDMRALLEPYGVTCIDAHEVRKQHPVRHLAGWELKAYAMLHSSFAEVLSIDADNVPVRDPSYLFDDPHYRAQGAVFWPDFNRLGPERPIWGVLGIPYRDEPEVESGQMLVDKKRCWAALQLAMHLNEHSDFYYRYVLGDKETFHLAWRKLGLEYAMPSKPVSGLPATMCQYDFEGRLLFQHRNFAKWKLDERNRRIRGFQYEEQCLAFLEELRALWSWQSEDGPTYEVGTLRSLDALAGAAPGNEPSVEVVVVHYRRPGNLPHILQALRQQSIPVRVNLIDIHPDSKDDLAPETLALADEVFRWKTNHGGFNRFIPALAFSAEYTMFFDDDLVPGRRCVEHMLQHARLLEARRTLPPLGALGQLGRRFAGGRYSPHDVSRSSQPVEVDCLVRGYLVPTRHLAHLASVRWQEPQLFYEGMGEDDLVLGLALKRAGLALYLTPSDPDPTTRMDAENLPEPHALSHRRNHLQSRDYFVRKHFTGLEPAAPHELSVAGV